MVLQIIATMADGWVELSHIFINTYSKETICYEVATLGLPADADEHAVFKALKEYAQRYDQELARTLARSW